MTAQPETLRIDIVSDVVCPWCIVGYKQLQQALDQVGDAVQAELHWHPFELNPQMPPEGQNLRDHIVEKYGTSPEASEPARARLTALGAELGFTFNYFDEMRMVNTFRAHQLLHWAEEAGGQTALKLALFESYFTRQEDVSDPAVLVAAAERAGLDAEAAAAVLHDGRCAEPVRARQRFWTERGIHAVPAAIFNQRYLMAGAQGVETYAAVLARTAAERAA